MTYTGSCYSRLGVKIVHLEVSVTRAGCFPILAPKVSRKLNIVQNKLLSGCNINIKRTHAKVVDELKDIKRGRSFAFMWALSV